MTQQPKQLPLLPKYNTEYESSFDRLSGLFNSICRPLFDLYPYKTNEGCTLKLPSLDIVLKNYYEQPNANNKRNRIILTNGWSDNYLEVINKEKSSSNGFTVYEEFSMGKDWTYPTENEMILLLMEHGLALDDVFFKTEEQIREEMFDVLLSFGIPETFINSWR